MTRSAFITGGGGGLGVAVVARFLTAGWNVTAPRRAEVDLTDPEAVRGAVEPARPRRRPAVPLPAREAGGGAAGAAPPLHAVVTLAGGFAAGEPVAETPVE